VRVRVVLGACRGPQPADLGVVALEAHLLAGGGREQGVERVADAVDLRPVVAVLLAPGRRVTEQVAQLVDQRDVLDAEVGVLGPGGEQGLDLVGLEHAGAVAVQSLGPVQPLPDLDRVERRPPPARELPHRAVATHLRHEVVVAALEGALALHPAPQQVQQRLLDPAHRPVALLTATQQLPADRGQVTPVEHQHLVAPEDAELLGRVRHDVPRGP
jgi:hypothetical protein